MMATFETHTRAHCIFKTYSDHLIETDVFCDHLMKPDDDLKACLKQRKRSYQDVPT